jgi:ABC-type dipeptide/oligopeptide/nickel transport system permease subunit
MQASITNDEAGSAYTSPPKPWASIRTLLKSIWQGVWIGAIGGIAFGTAIFSIYPTIFHLMHPIGSVSQGRPIIEVIAQGLSLILFIVPIGGFWGALVGLPLGLANGLLCISLRRLTIVFRTRLILFYASLLLIAALYFVISVFTTFGVLIRVGSLKPAPDTFEASAALLAAIVATLVLRRNLRRQAAA